MRHVVEMQTRRVLASGFHFIPDRPNEAHREDVHWLTGRVACTERTRQRERTADEACRAEEGLWRFGMSASLYNV